MIWIPPRIKLNLVFSLLATLLAGVNPKACKPGALVRASPAFPARRELPSRIDSHSLTQSPCVQCEVSYIPQIGDGDGFRTAFFFHNRGDETTASVEFLDSEGQPLRLDLDDFGEVSTFTIRLGRGESFSARSTGLGLIKVGYARILANGSVGAAAVFSQLGDDGTTVFETGVPATNPLTDFSLFVDSRDDRSTGLAIVNASQATANVILRLYDQDFDLLDQTVISLPAGAHRPRFIEELLPEAVPIQGSLTVESDQPLAAVTLRQGSDFPTLAAFPVIEGRPERTLTIRFETFEHFKQRHPGAIDPMIDWDSEPIDGAGSGGLPIAPGTSATQSNSLTAALGQLGLTIESLQSGFDAIIDQGRFFDATNILVSSETFGNGTHIRLLFGDKDPNTPGEQLPLAVWLHTSGNSAAIYATEEGESEELLGTAGDRPGTDFSNNVRLVIESSVGIRSVRIEGQPRFYRIIRGLSFAGAATASGGGQGGNF